MHLHEHVMRHTVGCAGIAVCHKPKLAWITLLSGKLLVRFARHHALLDRSHRPHRLLRTFHPVSQGWVPAQCYPWLQYIQSFQQILIVRFACIRTSHYSSCLCRFAQPCHSFLSHILLGTLCVLVFHLNLTGLLESYSMSN